MNEPSETICKDYPKSYVAVLDILGFKDIVRARSHEELKLVYQRFCEAIKHGLSNDKYVCSDDGKTKSIGPDIQQATVNSLLVSDSIWVWSDDNSVESFGNIVRAVQNLLAFSILKRILLRGAISIGPLTMVKNQWPSQTYSFQYSLFGKAIVDAVEAEEMQEWCGCVITEAAMECYKKDCFAGKSLIEKKVIVFYPVSIKGKEINSYVINWVNHPECGIEVKTIKNAFAHAIAPQKPPASDEWEKIKGKIANTLKFVEYVKNTENQSFVPWCSRP